MGALAMIGIAAFPLLPVAPLPQVDFPTVQVSAQLPGASSDTMASTVAAPLERQFGQIPGVTQMTSTSVLGSTSITLQFDLNRNVDAAAQDVQAAITAAGRQLPQTLTSPPTYRKVNPADSPILILAAHSDSLPLTTIDAAKGSINTDRQSFTIQANDQLTKAEPYNDVIVAYRNGAPVRIRDVGRAVAGPQDSNIAALMGNSQGPREA